MKENSIEEDITRVKQRIEDVKEYIKYGLSYSEYLDLENSFDNILSDYKRVSKENELLRKDIEGWKKYCEEIEEEQTEISNKNCELEFEVEKLQKENKELKEK